MFGGAGGRHPPLIDGSEGKEGGGGGGKGNPDVQRRIQNALKSYDDCVREGLGPVAGLKEVAKEASKHVFGNDKKENPDPRKITNEARAKSSKRLASVLAECLKKNPLAALAPGYGGPPPGDVFEGIPPLENNPIVPN